MSCMDDAARLLHIYSKAKDCVNALRIYVHMRDSGLDIQGSLGNDLVSMLVSVGRFHDAQQVFDTLASPNQRAWNGLISTYVKCGKAHDAITLYQRMEKDKNVLPDAHTFVAVMKACAKLKDLESGLKIHARIAELGLLNGNKFVGSMLVDMYAKCGLLAKAEKVFDKLPGRDVVSWTALVGGYAEHGRAEDALACFERMQHEGVFPNAVTYICSLKACKSIRAIAKGREIHSEIERQGLLERDLNVGNSLIDMYAKWGFLAMAHEVFGSLPTRDVITWTALIGGYAEHSYGEEALECFEQMKHDGVCANSVTLVCSLKACGSLQAIDKGRELHAEIERQGWLVKDVNVSNALVDMYAKCGFLVKAQQVFSMLPLQNKVSWSTLITGYTEHGFADEALNCFKQMQSEGVFPDAVTYLGCLKACRSIGAIAEGQDMHAEIERQGLLEVNNVLGNALVDMYGKCGCLAKAEEVFESLSVRNLVSWNAILSSYIEWGHALEAIECLQKMQFEGIAPDVITFVCSLKAYGEVGDVEKGLDIHAEIERLGFLKGNLGLSNTVVDMYARFCLLEKARQVFDLLQGRNVVSWNALISGYIEYGNGNEAVKCFKQMQLEGVYPDKLTFICTLKACGSIGAQEKAGEIHAELERRSLLQGNLDVSNTLVDAYVKCGLLGKARQIFDSLSVLDVVSWNALIAGYTESEQSEEAIECFERMQSEGVSPDSITFICILKAFGSMGATDRGEEVHAEIERQGLLEKNFVLGSTLIDTYAKCGFLPKAQNVFDKLLIRGIICWTALMSGYAQLGQSKTVFGLLDKMLGEKIKPDMVTFIIVLNACSRTGLFDKSQMYLEAMSQVYGVAPTLEHQACVIDVLGRTGELDKAVAMARKLPNCPNLVVWQTVLGACRTWGSIEVGKQAFENALLLDENNAAT